MNVPVIEVKDIVTRLSGALIHDGVSLSVQRGEVAALIGGSGTGKSVLLKEIIGLIRPQSGSIRLFGEDVWAANESQLMALRRRFGVLFQDGALFSSLTVEQNVAAPLREHTSLSPKECLELARLKIALVGLPASACGKMPSELSGGMRKRAALARALAIDPELVFLDEPTAGLDPLSASGIDELVRFLRDALGLPIMMVTHDLDLLWRVADRVAVLGDRHIGVTVGRGVPGLTVVAGGGPVERIGRLGAGRTATTGRVGGGHREVAVAGEDVRDGRAPGDRAQRLAGPVAPVQRDITDVGGSGHGHRERGR